MEIDKKKFFNKAEIGKTLLILLVIGVLISCLVIFLPSLDKNQSSQDHQVVDPKVQQLQTKVKHDDEIENKKLFAEIVGAINKPGIYQLDIGKRIIDLIELAGGYSKDVDTVRADLSINRLEKIYDGMKVYIPSKQVQVSIEPSLQNLRVRINSATKAELNKIPGVGESTADKIIFMRPYTDIKELVTKGILKAATFDKVRDKLAL